MFQGAKEPMASSTGMKSVRLQFLAVDEIWPDKADPRFPALLRASPAHPGDGEGALLTFLLTPQPALSGTWITPSKWKEWQAGFPQRLFTCLKCQLGYFSPPPSLSPPPPPPRSSLSKADEMPRRNVTPASRFALGHKLHFDNGICSVGGQIPLHRPCLVLTIISHEDKVH